MSKKLGTEVAVKVRDHLTNRVGSSFDRVMIWTGELPGSIEASLAFRGDSGGAIILVGLRSGIPLRQDASGRTSIEGVGIYITIVRPYNTNDPESQMIQLYDDVTLVRDAMNERPSSGAGFWWGIPAVGFAQISEGNTNNFSGPKINYGAFEIDYEVGIKNA
jgi:hypothetical protein